MKKFLKTPKGLLIVILACMFALIEVINFSLQSITHLAASVAFCTMVDTVFMIAQKRKKILPDGAIITGMIIGGILSSNVSFVKILLTCLIAILAKHVLKADKRLIFNPATIALCVSAMMFSTGQSWWIGMGTLPAWFTFAVIVPGFYITYKVAKFPLVFSFLFTYFLMTLLAGLFHVGNVTGSLQVPFVNVELFFAFFMLTDPPTTPAKNGEQVVWGTMIGCISSLIYMFHGGLTYLFVGLLIGNAAYFVRRSLLQSKKQPRKETARNLMA